MKIGIISHCFLLLFWYNHCMPQRSINLAKDVEPRALKYKEAYNISLSRAINRAWRVFWKSLSKEEKEFVMSFSEERKFIEDDESLDELDEAA